MIMKLLRLLLDGFFLRNNNKMGESEMEHKIKTSSRKFDDVLSEFRRLFASQKFRNPQGNARKSIQLFLLTLFTAIFHWNFLCFLLSHFFYCDGEFDFDFASTRRMSDNFEFLITLQLSFVITLNHNFSFHEVSFHIKIFFLCLGNILRFSA